MTLDKLHNLSERLALNIRTRQRIIPGLLTAQSRWEVGEGRDVEDGSDSERLPL